MASFFRFEKKIPILTQQSQERANKQFYKAGFIYNRLIFLRRMCKIIHQYTKKKYMGPVLSCSHLSSVGRTLVFKVKGPGFEPSQGHSWSLYIITTHRLNMIDRNHIILQIRELYTCFNYLSSTYLHVYMHIHIF